MFQGRSEDGTIAVRKRIHLNEINYRLRLQIEIENLTGKPLVIPESVHLILGPGLGEYPAETFGIAEKLYSFVEPIIAVDSKVKPVNLQKGEITVEYTNNMQPSFWCGLHSRYFALLLMPEDAYLLRSVSFRPGNELVSSYLPTRYLPELSIDLNVIKLQPRQLIKIEFLIFSGPKSVSVLGIEGTDFSGLLFAGLWNWMRGLSLGVLWMLETIHTYIPSWGVTILILAIIVRLLMYPIAQRALSSQKQFAEVQKTLQPKIREIKLKFRGGQQSEKILELYKQYQVSPLAGLKPLLIVLIQVPIFVALFHVLGSAFELRDANFLWIKTLAEPDRLIPLGRRLPFVGSYFNVLPIILAVSTLLTIKLSPAPSAEEKFLSIQNVFLILMAIGFFLIFYSFPAGMVLYWTMANLLHILQFKIVSFKKSV
jgi:YidC/Oxa1 family membrane protein insertase